MTDVISLSEAGMINSLQRMSLISHNLANANTNGYRRGIAASEPFQVRLDQLMQAQGAQFPALMPDQIVPQMKTVMDSGAGSLRHTGNPLDFAIEGNGFFEFSGPDGVYYSRRGVFTRDAAGNLVTADGRPVHGLSGSMRLADGEPRVDRDGMIWIDDEYIGQLKIVQFADAAQLEKAGDNYFRIGRALIVEDGEPSVIRQGHVEGSNVNTMSEMVSMMTTLRHIETTQRVVTGYDEIIGTAIETIGEF